MALEDVREFAREREVVNNSGVRAEYGVARR